MIQDIRIAQDEQSRRELLAALARNVKQVPDASCEVPDGYFRGENLDIWRALQADARRATEPRAADITDTLVADHGWQRDDAEAICEELRSASNGRDWRDIIAGKRKLGSTLFGEVLAMDLPLREPLIHGLLRRGETCNVIAESKIGKSWLVGGLALCVATGRPWLDRFAATRGRVLIIDNELHLATLRQRLIDLADALNIAHGSIADRIAVESLRGSLCDIHTLARRIRVDIEPGQYDLIVLDALYRLLPAGADENSNADMAAVYNTLDAIASHTGAAIVTVHHSSKGNQSGKRTTDVGSGAGAISRAADTHLVLRQHAEPSAAVAHAVTRSMPAPEPFCLRWEYPRWLLAPELDPSDLAQPHSRRKCAKQAAPVVPWDARRFAAECVPDRPCTREDILAEATRAGLSQRQANNLLRQVREQSLVEYQPGAGRTPALYCRQQRELRVCAN